MELTLELVRATKGGNAHAFRFGRQEYLLRTPGGRYKTTSLDWDNALEADLLALRSPGCDPALVQQMGDRMRRFVSAGIWGRLEAGIEQARVASEPVRMTIRSAAAELYLLPWELLTLEATGQHIGELPDLLIRYAWPQTVTAGSLDGDPTERVLLAWSAAGGPVPAAEHRQAMPPSCEVLEHASWNTVRTVLQAAEDADTPITALHLLCHGEQRDSTVGLVWNDDNADRAWISAANLRQLLEPFTNSLRLVVLCACHSSDSGAPGNHLGSVTQAVHRIGVPWVVGARYPLGKRASIEFADAFYGALTGEPRAVESAFLAARDRLLSPTAHHGHWMGMQLYCRPQLSAGADASERASTSEPTASVRELVDELVARLAEQRRLNASREATGELAERIDGLVSGIKRRFSPAEGETVAGAVLERVIGSGNFGTIWQATSEETGERVAVKIFRMERLAEGQMLSRFRRSIRAMRLLSEDKRRARRVDTRGHIVRFRDADDSGLAFAMDYLSAGNLENVEQRDWSHERKLQIMLSVCSAVRYAHDNGVIHRDIKPANIVLDDRDEPVLTDFDIADIKWATSLSTTVEGGLGTPVFAAPEQLVDADTATERADVYSLGRFLYYLLLERSPGYEVEKDPSLTNLSGERPALVEIVRRATQYEPMRRYPSAAEMMRDLESCHTGAAAVRARVARMGRWLKHNRALLVIVALLVGGSVGFSLYQSQVAETERAHRERAERAEAEAKRIAEANEKLAEEMARLADDVAEAKNRDTDLSKRIDQLDRKLALLRQQHKDAPTEQEAAHLAKQIADTQAERDREHQAREEVRAELERFEKKLKERAKEVKAKEASRIELEKAIREAERARARAREAQAATLDAGNGAGEHGSLVFKTSASNAMAHLWNQAGEKLGPFEVPNFRIDLPAGAYTLIVVSGSAWWSGLVTVSANAVLTLEDEPRSYQPNGESRGVVHTALKDTDVPMKFIGLTGGRFTMGSPPDAGLRYSQDAPLHQVYVSTFQLARTKVTQKQWRLVMGANPSDCDVGCGDDRPVQNITWHQAVEFLDRLSEREQLTPCYTRNGSSVRWNNTCTGYRLPTEAEWEYACRAGTTSVISVDDLDADARPNAWQLRNMQGRGWEWLWDRYGPYSLTHQPIVNPYGPSEGRFRVLRGYSGGAVGLRCAIRNWLPPGYRHEDYGLRAARGPRRQR